MNVTLIFGLERYAEVIDAYLSGLEHAAGRGSRPARDRLGGVVLRLEGRHRGRRRGSTRSARPSSLKGRAAVAQAKLAYELFTERHADAALRGARRAAARGRSARSGRRRRRRTPRTPTCSTSTRSSGPQRSTRCPTRRSRRSATTARSRGPIDADVDAARATLADGRGAPGISMDDVAAVLERQGRRLLRRQLPRAARDDRA